MNAAAARTAYTEGSRTWRQAEAACLRGERWFVSTRVLLFVAGLAAVGGAITGWFGFEWLLVPTVGFLPVAILHERQLRRGRHAARAARWHEAGLSRLDGTWPGQGDPGDDLAPEDHPYARELDLFGRGSLYERLATTRTRAGRRTLADWLCKRGSPGEIAARQLAVRELIPRLAWRERLALLGEETAAQVHDRQLARWGQAEPGWNARRAAAIAILGIVLNLTSLALALLQQIPNWVPVLVLAGAGLVAMILKPAVDYALRGAVSAASELRILAGLLAQIELERFESPRLQELQRKISAPPGAALAIARLVGLLDRLDWRRNQVFLPLSLLGWWTTLHAAAVERWRREHGVRLHDWLEAAGEIDALAAIASFGFEQADAVFPELVSGAATYTASGLGHPLLGEQECIRNDVALGGAERVWIVSGSNMSGKSTLLRSVGINAVLALAGAPVRARSLRLTPLAVGASLRTQDSLLDGRSRFMAELQQLERIVRVARSGEPLLFLIDELLSGTNSHDRRIGAQALALELWQRGAIGLLTTHDLAITGTVAAMQGEARNVHFVDHLEAGAMQFDYRLHDGVVTKSNALALMRLVGLLPPEDQRPLDP